MNNKDIHLIVNRILKRERQGSTMSVSDFNRFLEVANQMEFDSLLKRMEATSDVIMSLRPIQYLYTHSDGSFELESRVAKILSVSYVYNGRTYQCDHVTSMEVDKIADNVWARPTVTEPVYWIMENAIQIFPIPPVREVTIRYISKPVVPYLDYYVNTAGQVVYLSMGVSVHESLIDADFKSFGADGNPLQIVNGFYFSKTWEMQWPKEEQKINVLIRILKLAGLTVPDPLTLQVLSNEQERVD